MLTLIVVIAASSFAVFISQEQAEAQAQELLEQRMALENITVLSISPYSSSSSTDQWTSLNFTIASICTQESTVSSVRINGLPLYNGTIWRVGSDGAVLKENYSFRTGIELDGLEYVYLNITADSFFENGVVLSSDSDVNIEMSTELLNTFNVNFVPPTALINLDVLSSWNGTAFVTSVILDGSLSDQIEPGYIIFYEWTVTNGGTEIGSEAGRKVLSPVTLSPGDTITLTVTNNFGMKGVRSITYGP